MGDATGIEPIGINCIDAEELACHVLGLDEDSEYDVIEDAVFDKFECNMETFQKIVEHLLPMADAGVSELTKEGYKGFSVPLDDEGHRMWVVKYKVQ